MINMNRILINNDSSILLYRVNQIACLMMCMWIAIPYFRVRVGVAFLLIMFGIWIITTDLKWLTKKLTLDLFLVVVFFATFIPYIVSGSLQYGEAGPNMIRVNFPIFFVGIFINHYYMYYKEDYKVLGRIAFFSLVFFTIGSIQTYIGLLKYPMASRELAGAVVNNPVLGMLYNKLGIGGFGHIYSASFLLVVSLYLLIRKSALITIKERILASITVISIFLMLLQASYATSLIIIFLGFLLVLFVRNISSFIISIIVAGTLFLIVPKNIVNQFLLEISYFFSGNFILNEKFSDLANTFLFNTGDGQTGDRIILYKNSLHTFFSNPLFGIYGPFGNLNAGSIGGHSGWLDLLGYYGLFTVIPLFLTIFFNFRKHMRFYKNTNFYGFIIVIFFLILVFGLINPILYVYEIGYVLFCIVPAIPFIGYAFNNNKVELNRSLKEGMEK
ncbi:O-antigen ligase family protein [Lysinibacillus sp. NPDC093688]|uniref:O-antigen ligase family protein n=1 Tax=Lysinibacillus sp. NPDC093688 TaxID=3390577 RepID=UPI003D006C66